MQNPAKVRKIMQENVKILMKKLKTQKPNRNFESEEYSDRVKKLNKELQQETQSCREKELASLKMGYLKLVKQRKKRNKIEKRVKKK